jgi:methyl-accepting chemotaxis protein
MRVLRSIALKLVVAITALSMTVLLGMAWTAYGVGADSARHSAAATLRHVNDDRAKALSDYVASVRADLDFLTQLSAVRLAARNMPGALKGFSDAQAQAAYIDDNPHPAGAKHRLDMTQALGSYDALHRAVHPTLRAYLELRGYYDIFIAGPEGRLVYTVYKERDFARSAVTGDIARSGLGEVVRAAAALDAGQHAFVDFAPYAPSAGAPAAFVAAPIRDGAGGALLGVAAVQLPIDQIAAILRADDAQAPIMSFLTGADGLLRSELALTPGDDPLTTRFPLDMAGGGAAVETAAFAGEPMLTTTRTMDFFGEEYAIGTAARLSWIDAGQAAMRDGMVASGSIGAAAVLALSIGVGLVVARPVSCIASAMARLAAGDIAEPVPLQNRSDEIGAMARNAEAFRQGIAEAEQARAANAAAEAAAQARHAALLATLEQQVGETVRAARAGDLGRRVTAKFDDPMLTGLADSVNALCDRVSNFVGEVGSVLGHLGRGDLSRRMGDGYQGAFAEAASGANGALGKLQEIVQGVARLGGEVSAASAEIAGTADSLSQRVEQQAAALEQTAATMKEMTATVENNTASAREVAGAASGTLTKAERSSQIVGEAVKAMGGIRASSERIHEITGVIESIAFQTNLLALNASVEAARAGEAGKGFAVVAQEVRALADRTSSAAGDIRGLIAQSGAQIAEGVTLVEQTGVALGDINASIAEVARAADEIAGASRDQSASIAEISSAVVSLDQITQQNAAVADESAAAARRLSEQTDALGGLMAFFEQRGGAWGRAA